MRLLPCLGLALAAGCRIPEAPRASAAADSVAVARAFAAAVRRAPVGTPFTVSWPAGGPARPPWADTARARLAEGIPATLVVTGVLWEVEPRRLLFAGDTARLVAAWAGCNLDPDRPAGPNVVWSEREYVFVRRAARWEPASSRELRRASDGMCSS